MEECHQWWREKWPKQQDAWRTYEDFKVFLSLVWSHLNLPPPTPIQLNIAHWLQHGPRRAIIQAFRGVGKSWITSAFVCWLLLRDPQLNILVVSASKERADNFTTFMLRLISDMPLLHHLEPREDQRCSKVAFDVSPAKADQAPSVRSVGITGQLTGGRADIIIPDDVEVPNNSATQMMRDRLSEAVKEFDAVLKPGGRILYLGTPQTELSLYKALQDRGYTTRIWPSEYPSTAKERAEYGDTLAPMIADAFDADATLASKSTDPVRFNDLDLLERKTSYGRSGYALQFLLKPGLSDQERYPLRLRDLSVMDLDFDKAPEKVIWTNGPEHVLNDIPCVGFNGDRFHRPMGYARDDLNNVIMRSYQGSVMTIDPSGRGKDETGVVITKMLNSMIFVVYVAGFRDGYGVETMKAIVNAAKLHKVNAIRIESNFGDGMFAALLKPYLSQTYPCTIEEERSQGQKEARIIDTLEPVMNQHRLVIDRRLIEQDYHSTDDLPSETRLSFQLFYQMTRITRDRGALRHDDRLDALAMAVAYWVEHMSKDIDKAINAHREEALRAELNRFMQHAVGRKPARTKWA